MPKKRSRSSKKENRKHAEAPEAPPSAESQAPSAPAIRPVATRPWLKVVAALMPIVFFVSLELGLRTFDYGPNLSLFVESELDPDYLLVNGGLGLRYFPLTKIAPMVSDDAFLKEKPDDVFRIFVLGGSSAGGWPYQYNGSFSSILRVILSEYYPDTPIEMMNMAMPAVPSYAVRDIALGLGNYEPDLLLLYTGHNEFYGALGVGSSESIGTSRALVRLILWLNHYRMFRLVGDGVRGLQGLLGNFSASSDEGASGGLMERLAGNRSIPHGSALFHMASDVFEANIQDVIDFGRAYGAPVMIGTLVSNIRDQEPFVDVYQQPELEAQWRARFRQAETFFSDDDLGAALSAVDDCIEFDALPASQYFLKGKILEASGNMLQAYAAYDEAKEMDGLRFRASEDINQRIEKLSEQENVTLVAVKDAFEANSDGRIPGESLFLEHLHPNLDGYALIAKTFAQAIVDDRIIGEPSVASVSDDVWLSKTGVTEIDLEVARLEIDSLTSSWPFTDQMPVSTSEYLASQQQALNTSRIQQLAIRLFQAEINWEDAHREAAEHYQQRQEWDKATQEYRALIHQMPMNDSPYHFLAKMLFEQDMYEEALDVYLDLAEISPGGDTDKMIGLIYIQQGNATQGIRYLEASLTVDPGDTEAHFNLARGHMMQGDFREAGQAILRVLSYDPNYPRAQQVADYLAQQLEAQ